MIFSYCYSTTDFNRISNECRTRRYDISHFPLVLQAISPRVLNSSLSNFGYNVEKGQIAVTSQTRDPIETQEPPVLRSTQVSWFSPFSQQALIETKAARGSVLDTQKKEWASLKRRSEGEAGRKRSPVGEATMALRGLFSRCWVLETTGRELFPAWYPRTIPRRKNVSFSIQLT